MNTAEQKGQKYTHKILEEGWPTFCGPMKKNDPDQPKEDLADELGWMQALADAKAYIRSLKPTKIITLDPTRPLDEQIKITKDPVSGDLHFDEIV